MHPAALPSRTDEERARRQPPGVLEVLLRALRGLRGEIWFFVMLQRGDMRRHARSDARAGGYLRLDFFRVRCRMRMGAA
jgi:hypothetical protein